MANIHDKLLEGKDYIMLQISQRVYIFVPGGMVDEEDSVSNSTNGCAESIPNVPMEDF